MERSTVPTKAARSSSWQSVAAQIPFEFARARADDPATSHEAAANVDRFAAGHFAIILKALRERGPATIDELATITRLDHWAIARRLPELERKGETAIVRVDGKAQTRPGVSGRAQRVWRIGP